MSGTRDKFCGHCGWAGVCADWACASSIPSYLITLVSKEHLWQQQMQGCRFSQKNVLCTKITLLTCGFHVMYDNNSWIDNEMSTCPFTDYDKCLGHIVWMLDECPSPLWLNLNFTKTKSQWIFSSLLTIWALMIMTILTTNNTADWLSPGLSVHLQMNKHSNKSSKLCCRKLLSHLLAY